MAAAATPDVPELPDSRLVPFLRSARDYLRRAMDLEIDESETSLAFVDHYLAGQRPTDDHALAPQIVGLLASALGVYFGEVCRRNLPDGASWEILGEDPRTFRIILTASGVSFCPAAMVATALYGDEVEGWDAALRPPEKWKNMLDRVLSSSAPVETAYFYSLTGRFESLQRISELVADFERMTQPSPASPESDTDSALDPDPSPDPSLPN